MSINHQLGENMEHLALKCNCTMYLLSMCILHLDFLYIDLYEQSDYMYIVPKLVTVVILISQVYQVLNP